MDEMDTIPLNTMKSFSVNLNKPQMKNSSREYMLTHSSFEKFYLENTSSYFVE